MKHFNLVISGNDEAWDQDYCRFPLERLFGYTEEAIKSWLTPVESSANLRELASYPTLLAYEKRCAKSAFVAQVSELRISGKHLIFKIQRRQDYAPIPDIFTQEMRFKLRIDSDFETNHTHWAVKEGDLYSILSPFQSGKREVIASSDSKYTNRVFLVHGHGNEELQTVARFLERIGLQPVILREQVDSGRTIIEKFEHHAEQANYAIILLTEDDLGRSKRDEILSFRARQNVILELGYFIGSLGRSRVCALKKGNLELPSDILGVVWKELDTADGWMMSLAKELKQAGLPVDASRLI